MWLLDYDPRDKIAINSLEKKSNLVWWVPITLFFSRGFVGELGPPWGMWLLVAARACEHRERYMFRTDGLKTVRQVT